jgi:hypothetical protein
MRAIGTEIEAKEASPVFDRETTVGVTGRVQCATWPIHSLSAASAGLVMKIRLTRKLAKQLDGIDLSPYDVGDVVELSAPEAKLLIAERWADPCETRATASPRQPRAAAAEHARKRRKPRR